jgi:hypothetical protein
MPLKLIVATCVIAFSGCATQSTEDMHAAPAKKAESTSVGIGDGRSFGTAVVINVPDEGAGVAAEYAWIREHIPGGRPEGQVLQHHGGKVFDMIHVKLPDNSLRDIYFDITGFFGKL